VYKHTHSILYTSTYCNTLQHTVTHYHVMTYVYTRALWVYAYTHSTCEECNACVYKYAVCCSVLKCVAVCWRVHNSMLLLTEMFTEYYGCVNTSWIVFCMIYVYMNIYALLSLHIDNSILYTYTHSILDVWTICLQCVAVRCSVLQ